MSRGGRTFYASPPQVRKCLRLRYGAVTSENGTPGDGSTGRGTGPAPRRAAKRQPAGTLSQTRAASRPRAAKAVSAEHDGDSALTAASENRPTATDETGPAATASGLTAAGTRPTGAGPGARSKTTAATSRSGATAGTRAKKTPAARSGSTPATPRAKTAASRARTKAAASAVASAAVPDPQSPGEPPPTTPATPGANTAATGATPTQNPVNPGANTAAPRTADTSPPAARAAPLASAPPEPPAAATAPAPADPTTPPTAPTANVPADPTTPTASVRPGSPATAVPTASAAPESDALADDEADGFRLLTPPAAGSREARPAPARPTTPATATPATTTPATATPAQAPADAPEEAADWYQPPVPSAMPYEFPSTGSVRLIPPSGHGPGARPTSRPSTASAAGRAAASPTSPRPVRPASTPTNAATPPADVTVEHAAPRYVIPGPPIPAPTAATDRAAGSPRAAPAPGAPTDGAAAGRTAPASAAGRPMPPAAVVPRLAGGDLFGRHTRSYAAENSGQQITILQAGCTTAEDLGVDPLRAAGARLSVSMIDEDNEVTRAAVAHHGSKREVILGDLRTVPLPPRAYDIVQCSSLLGRIEHAELVLDRLSAAVKPGGLLLLRIRDRDSAAGFLDRVLPGPFRRAIWRKRHPGEPGPYAAVYERLASGRGVQSYVLMHGLVIAERGALGGLAGGLPRGPHGYLTAQKLVARLSRGRLTSAHEDLLYVIRKPEDRFARII